MFKTDNGRTVIQQDDLVYELSVTPHQQLFVFIVYNAEEAHLYVHHETLLPALPLCMEWMDYNPNEDTPGIEYLS